MKKINVALLALLVCGAGYAAQDTTLTQAEVRDPRRLETYLEANATDAQTRLAAVEIGTSNTNAAGNFKVGNSLTVNTNATIGGKSTLNGELEVNNSDVDINMTLTGNEIDIAQTNTTGTASTPLINVNDDRTGATANEASEAALYIDADGAYGLTVADGILQIEAEIDTAAGDILLDPAGSEVHIDGGLHVGGTDAVGDNNLKVDGTAEITGVATFTAESVHNGGIDADYITTDAGDGIDAKVAGALTIAKATATGVDVGNATTTNMVFTTDGTGTGEIVLPNESIGNAEIADVSATKLTAATIATAIDGSAITNITAANVQAGISAAKLTAGTVATAIDGSGVTNIAGGNIASGNIAAARIATALGTSGASIGGNIPVAAITNGAGTLGPSIGGNIPEASITNALATAGPTIGGNIPVAAITNAAGTLGASLGGNIPLAAVTNALETAVIPQAGITNALASAGPTIGGNIPLAAMTNGFGTSTLYSGTYTNLDAVTNAHVVVVVNGLIQSVTP